MSERLFDFGKGQLVPFASLIDELIDLIAEDAAVLGCEREVQARAQHRDGRHQRRPPGGPLQEAAGGRRHNDDALVGVVDQLIAETVAGT